MDKTIESVQPSLIVSATDKIPLSQADGNAHTVTLATLKNWLNNQISIRYSQIEDSPTFKTVSGQTITGTGNISAVTVQSLPDDAETVGLAKIPKSVINEEDTVINLMIEPNTSYTYTQPIDDFRLIQSEPSVETTTISFTTGDYSIPINYQPAYFKCVGSDKLEANTAYVITIKENIITPSVPAQKYELWFGTKQQFDAIEHKQSNTIYLVAEYGVYVGNNKVIAVE